MSIQFDLIESNVPKRLKKLWHKQKVYNLNRQINQLKKQVNR